MALLKSAWGIFAALVTLAYVFCVVGPALCITVLILTGTGVHGAEKRRTYSRFMLCWAGNTFEVFRFLMRIRMTSPSFSDPEFRPAIVIANHQSLTDIFVIMKLLPKMGCWDARWVMKKELAAMPVVAQVCRGNACAFIDRNDPVDSQREIRQAARTTNEDAATMVIFPEGTRFVPREDGYPDPAGGPNYHHVRAPKPEGFMAIKEEMPSQPILLMTIDWGAPVKAKSFFQLGALFGRTVQLKTELYDVPNADATWLNARWREIENGLEIARRK